MGRHLVLVGGGHAHLHALAQARGIQRRGHRITLVNPKPWHDYSGMASGFLGGHYTLEQIRFPLDAIAHRSEVETVWERVVKIHPEDRRLELASGASLAYDVASFNVGSDVPVEVPAGLHRKVYTVKPVDQLVELRDRLVKWPAGTPCRLAVVGGGPSGVEMAGNVRRLMDAVGLDGRVLLLAGDGLLPSWPARMVGKIREYLRLHAIQLMEGARVSRFGAEELELGESGGLRYDLALVAVGTRPSSLFSSSGLAVGPDGGMSVNPFLQAVETPELFGGGDCIHFSTSPLAKAGVYAVRQAPVLMHNLVAALEERPLSTYTPQQTFLQILNLGDNRAALLRPPLSFLGVIPWRIKESIDTAFMREYLPA